MTVPFIAVDLEASLPDPADIARKLLVEQRISEPGYQPPEKQLRHALRTKKRKEAARNGRRWVFSKPEVAKAFHNLIYTVPLPPVQVAQALLTHAPRTSILELWSYLSSPSSKKFRRKKASLLVSLPPKITWLDIVVVQEALQYVRLLCQGQIGQDAIDRALGIALSRRFMVVATVLLSFQAVASASQEGIREYVRQNDISIVKLLLSAPSSSMSVEAWCYCLTPAVSADGRSEILQLCLARCPELACASLLLGALQSQNLEATKIIFNYAGPTNDFHTIHQLAYELVFRIDDCDQRLSFLTTLCKAGFVGDELAVRRQLMVEVKARNMALVKLLISSGVYIDVSPYNSSLWAINNLDFQMLEVLKMANTTSSLATWLKCVPKDISEDKMLQLLAICNSQGKLDGEPLDWHLDRAVQRKEKRLIRTLVDLGASIDFDKASAIRQALKIADLATLDILMKCPSSPDILSFAIPDAMQLEVKSQRFEAMRALLGKGVHSQELAEPLRTAVLEDSEVDTQLIRLLLQHKAPVDGGERASNPLLCATRKGNLPVLQMLCGAPVSSYTLSEAIPIAYRMRNIHKPGIALKMMELFMLKGAHGSPVDLVLLAAVKDSDMAMIQLLLKGGADANHDSGASFLYAIQASQVEILRDLCARCSPTNAIKQSLLRRAVEPDTYSLPILEILLDAIPSATLILKVSLDLLASKDNPNIAEIVSCFLRHGLDVNAGDGALLCVAVEVGDVKFLATVLSHNPNTISLRQAFKTSAKVESRSLQLEMKKALLEKAGSTEIGQSDHLLQETIAAIAGDSQGLKILIRHNATGDFKGEYLRAPAAAGALNVLNMLLSLDVTSSALKKACLAATESDLSGSRKQMVVERLLDFRKLPNQDMSEVLVKCLSGASHCVPLAETLLRRGAKVTFEILEDAAQHSPEELFAALIAGANDNALDKMFLRTIYSASLRPNRTYFVLRHLLEKRVVPRDELSRALIHCISVQKLEDISLPRLLLTHGADAGFQKGEAFTMAFRFGSFALVNLLTQYIVEDSIADHVFQLARKAQALGAEKRLELYRRLLQRGTGISTSSKYLALLENLKSPQRDVALVRLLLASGVDPNTENAQSFIIAAKAGAKPEFRALSKKANLTAVTEALMANLKNENEEVEWLRICLEERSTREPLEKDDLVLKCLRKFPRGTSLLRLLLNTGASISATTRCRLSPGWDAEDCTILIWALMSKTPRISDEAILLLIQRGRRAVRPEYVTQLSKVSAAFVCILDLSRAMILKALLELDEDGTMEQTMSGSGFSNLVRSQHDLYDEMVLLPTLDEVKLTVACLVMGNLNAFVQTLTRSPDSHTESFLHFAALLGLPKIVEWLLRAKRWDANHADDHYDFWIPLAVACRAQPIPDCVFAEATSEGWTARQKTTMRLLAEETDVKWRSHRKMSVLHIALDYGPQVTKLMVEALDIAHDSSRDKTYLFEDRTGLIYSPDQYVNRILGPDIADRQALLDALAVGRMASRYYKAVSPKEGTQPEGYIGLPPELAKEWEAHRRGEN